ncbi:hypothetical protein [Legionella drancourtii]|uniref:Uncharacterized protein n=1 Tax=Legionella drancourtii LLAP12 TaxID=658187 RepID=G9ERZ9_9GAMM|nr:hypothetical protein [Legionella drancourtii]EHL29780.1 hypothetical protein LDG_8071 [Legionella drancourtii LLAP12]
MFFSCPQKAKHSYFFGKQIDDLAAVLSSYINREADFPYSKLHDLYTAIELIENNHMKTSLLARLNKDVISRLYQHNPKLYSLYVHINAHITELMEADSADYATQISSIP